MPHDSGTLPFIAFLQTRFFFLLPFLILLLTTLFIDSTDGHQDQPNIATVSKDHLHSSRHHPSAYRDVCPSPGHSCDVHLYAYAAYATLIAPERPPLDSSSLYALLPLLVIPAKNRRKSKNTPTMTSASPARYANKYHYDDQNIVRRTPNTRTPCYRYDQIQVVIWPSRDPIGERGWSQPVWHGWEIMRWGSWDYLGLIPPPTGPNLLPTIIGWLFGGDDDGCEEGDIRYIRFCVIIKVLDEKTKYCSDQASKVIADIVKGKALDKLEKLEPGKNLPTLLKNLRKGLGIVGKFDAAVKGAFARGTFSIGMEVDYSCCVCPEKDWVWGEARNASYWLGDQTEPAMGLRYNFASPAAMADFSNDYKRAVGELASKITTKCKKDED